MSEAKNIVFTEAEMQKIATFLSESGKLLQHTTEVSKNLLEDNEKLAAEVEQLKAEKHAAERSDKINKIAETLNNRGFISKAAMPQKIEEFNKMADEALDQMLTTVRGLSGTPAEKVAAEGMFSTLDFLDPAIVNQVFNDGKPRPFSLL